MNYIKAHPFSAVNLGAGSEVSRHSHFSKAVFSHCSLPQVRYIAPVFPWNDPKFARPPVSSLQAPQVSGALRNARTAAHRAHTFGNN